MRRPDGGSAWERLYISASGPGPPSGQTPVMDKQRNFWCLYRANALPKETRAYVPKVVAAIIVGRNPRHFGF
jgi:membrane-bound lytic murein transglycosylase D